MNEFLNRVVGNNPVSDYLWVLGVILFVLLFRKIASRYIAGLLCRLFRGMWKTFDAATFINLIINPLSVFLVVTVTIIALYRLNFPQDLNFTLYRYPLQQILLGIGSLLQVITFIWLILRIIDFIATVLERHADKTVEQGDNQLIVFFRDFLKVIVILIGIVMILHFAFGYNVGSLLTGLSLVGAAIALALKESLENLIASFVIFFDKPFTQGDFVKVHHVSGNVERIGLRSTRIRTSDKSYVTVPNKQMVDSILDNISLRSQMKGFLELQLNLQTKPEKIESLMNGIRTHLKTVPEVQNSTVLFADIRLQAFVVTIEFYTIPIANERFIAIRQELNFFVLKTMDAQEILVAAEGKDVFKP